ncbi:MAG: lysophospholipid acyltransferase family protein [Candidatus Woykebacteria bacterium]
MSIAITFSQILVYFILVLPIRFFLRVKGKHNLKSFEALSKKNGVLLISNHTSRTDPFVIFSSFPFSVFYKLVPIHFMTSSAYLNNWLQRLILTLLGCFPHKTSDPTYSSVFRSVELISRGERVLIFPEGKRVKLLKSSEPKRGIGTIVLESSYSVLPIRIIGVEHLTIGKILRRGLNATIVTDTIISNQEAKSISTDPNIIAKELMKRVYELN